ncbi:hypothetical protein [Pandoraea sp. NPDC090278]|uniref:hypothetical protein n=1 Tax=Pandoraea sp. NPDC090278 TaxID=3364391 RepID=UPI00383A7F6F
MSAKFNEGLVERSYHAVWERHFSTLLSANGFETFVPGVEEVHVGFDLGFARNNSSYKFTGDQFFEWMKNRIAGTTSPDSAFLYAYFYQYKLTEKVGNLSKIKDKETRDTLIGAFGYVAGANSFRAKLDTRRNVYAKGTKIRPFSQHEALCRLARVKGADVSYCTPRFLESTGIPPEPKRKLTDLNVVPVINGTPELNDGKVHYLYYENLFGKNPTWCSAPLHATLRNDPPVPRLISPLNLLRMMKANFTGEDGPVEIDYSEIEITDVDLSKDRFLEYLHALPTCTRIVNFGLPDVR